MDAKIVMDKELLEKILLKNFREMRDDNSPANRFYALGLIHIAQFSNDIDIQNLIQEAHMFINSTTPEVN